ncbi:thiosulfate dehydrogenase [quinone] large subunit [Haloferula luteola]|uniref:Thiosulfate dehydrogenase [quinone] large subunit n=1 Tax=Haloferula luteola TaxID=595692 RepID=A0A840V3E0_9BACT|nr:DoxX family membrane protein [Haloferula luteola]MBB5350174.1 thiosulfate dehydrogenase [quinone] large subunit [Haloferula luteola]
MKLPDNDASLAYALARLGLGINIALHGLTRLPHLQSFAAGLREQFAATFLPSASVTIAAYGIAIAEALLGVLLLLGTFLRPTLIAGSLLMSLLLFGTCLIQNWNAAGIQMIYLAFYSVMLATAKFDAFSIDALRRRA